MSDPTHTVGAHAHVRQCVRATEGVCGQQGGQVTTYMPGRTLPVRVELVRQLRRRRTQIVFGLIVALPVILWIAFTLAPAGPPSNSVSLVDLAKSGGANFAVFALFASASFLLVVVVALFFGDTVAAEASWSSLRYLLAAPVPRSRLVRQKAIVAAILSAAAVLLLPMSRSWWARSPTARATW